MMVFANVIGSVVNKVIAQGIIMTILMVMIFLGILINIRNAIKKYREESENMQNEIYKSVNYDSEKNENSQDEPKIEFSEENEEETELHPNLNPNNFSKLNPDDLQEIKEVRQIQKYEGRNFNPKKVILFGITIVITIIYSLLKGTSSIDSLIDLDVCQWEQLPLFFGLILIIIGIQIYSIKLVKREQFLKIKYHLHYEHEVKFTNKRIIFLILFAIIVGFLANLLGLGGGFVIFPMLVMIKVSPLVASATTIFMIFLSKFVAALLAFFSEFLKLDYTLVSVVFVVCSVLFFSKISDIMIKK